MPPKKRAQTAKTGTVFAAASTSSGRVTRAKRAPVVVVPAKAAVAAQNGKKKAAAPTTSSPRAKKAKTATSSAVVRDRANGDSAFEYEDIEASWDTRVEYSIVTETSTGGTMTLEGSVNGTGPLEETERIAKLFERASARNLTLNIRDDSTKAFLYYTAVFGSLKYQNLTIRFEGEYDHAKFFAAFFPVLVKGGDFANGKLTLKWGCDRPQSLPLLRQTLRTLPKVAELDIVCAIAEKNGTVNYGTLYDDATLRHLVAVATNAKLDNAHNVTAQGVLDAFEEVCKSGGDDKYVLLHVKDAVIDEVFRLGEQQKSKQMNSTVLHRRLLDPKRGKMLVEWGKTAPDTIPIVMQRHQETTPAPNNKK